MDRTFELDHQSVIVVVVVANSCELAQIAVLWLLLSKRTYTFRLYTMFSSFFVLGNAKLSKLLVSQIFIILLG